MEATGESNPGRSYVLKRVTLCVGYGSVLGVPCKRLIRLDLDLPSRGYVGKCRTRDVSASDDTNGTIIGALTHKKSHLNATVIYRAAARFSKLSHETEATLL